MNMGMVREDCVFLWQVMERVGCVNEAVDE